MTSPENADTEAAAPRRRSGLLGAGIGVVALVASLLAFSTLAGAQDSSSELVDPDSTPAEAEGDDAGDEDRDDTDEYVPYENCFEDLLGRFGNIFDGEGDAELDKNFDEETFDDGAIACDDLLPQGAKDEIAKFEDAFNAFDTCLADAGVGFPDALDGLFEGEFDGPFDGEFFDGEFGDEFPADFGPIVSVMNGDSLSVAEFGDGDGTITITKSGDEISVSSSGDVTIDDIDFDDHGMELDGMDFDFDLGELGEEFQAFEDALSACEDVLPDDLLDGDFFFGGGEFHGETFDWNGFEHDDAHEDVS